MNLRTLTAAAVLLLAATASRSHAQAPAQRTEPVAVFLDCHGGCDGELIRTEITWVNWVRERLAADVHLLITGEGAGTGGQRFTLAFLGLRGFAGKVDTLTYTSTTMTTQDERRRGLLQTIAVGLVRYAALTPVGSELRITQAPRTAGSSASQTAPTNDPWKAWVFNIGFDGSMDGEKSYRGRNVSGRFGADRVTEAWKTNFNYRFSYRDNETTIQDFDDLGNVTSEETYSNVQRDWRGALGIVKSLGNHLSAGGDFEFASQTFRNQDLRIQSRAAVEFSVFPYTENTRRELSARYGIGVSSYKYADTTVFDKLSESLPSHFIEVSYRTRQPWGGANVNFEHRNFLTDAAKRTTEINGGFNVRVFRGMSINMGAGYEWIRDQIYLPKGARSAVDVFLRRRALLTGFSYHTNIGVSYTFGSIFNNVVNPRF